MERIVLITGGNKGLGFETAKVLQQKGYNVYIGSRDAERGRQAADELGVKYVQLDVTDDISIQQAYLQIQDREGRLDILINNAGISGGFKKPADLTVNDVQQVYNTNVFGIVRMMHTFIPLLEKSEQPVVVNVSSGLGSFGMVTNPNTQESKVNSLAYCSSKHCNMQKAFHIYKLTQQILAQRILIWWETLVTMQNLLQKGLFLS